MTTRNRNLAIALSLLGPTALLFTSPANPAFAQQPPPAVGGPAVPARLSATDRDGALKAIEKVVQDSYVFSNMRAKLIERLRQGRKAGRYDVDQSHVFADRITEDLKDVSHDGHLSLHLAPAEYAAAVAPPAGDRGAEGFARRRAVRHHYGLTDLRILPGNIRYLKIAGFEWVDDETGAAYDDAMRLPATSSALTCCC
jgi:hypothetical protein